MSEYIFRTENPIKDCSICPFVKTAICPSKDDRYIPFGYKRGDCPVNEVPPHGDLKDYDSLGNKMSNLYMKNKEKWSPDYIEGFLRALKMLDKAPTFIEASKERKK